MTDSENSGGKGGREIMQNLQKTFLMYIRIMIILLNVTLESVNRQTDTKKDQENRGEEALNKQNKNHIQRVLDEEEEENKSN